MKMHSIPPVMPHMVLPKERPPMRPARRGRKKDESFDWGALVSLIVHPIKVEIIEALKRIEQPLSASELTSILEDGNRGIGVVAYHVNSLAEMGAIVATHQRQARGARETYYSFPDPV